MRVMCVALGGFLLATATLHADVKLAVRRDGKKVIYNVGRAPNGSKGSDLAWLARRHDHRSKFDPIIERYAEKYDVDATLIRAVIQVESNFNPNCVSSKGARGLMQLMPATARRFGVKKIHDPDENIHGGVRFLAYLLRLFNGDLTRVLAGYNAGENAVIRYGGVPPYDETTTYVARALTVYHGRPYGAAVSFAGRRGKAKLSGGFGRAAGTPVTVALIPGAKVLGTQ